MHNSGDDVWARVPELTPGELAASRAETIEAMLELLEPWSQGRWAFSISKLVDVLGRFRAPCANPPESDVEDLELEFLGLLFEMPPFRCLELAASSLPAVHSITGYLSGLEAKARDGTITDDEAGKLPELKRSRDSLQSDIRQYLKEFEDLMGDRSADEIE